MATTDHYTLNQLLERLNKLEARSQLGFGPAPVTRTIHCKRREECLWYFWNGPEGAEPIAYEAITGYARELRITQGEYKNKPTYHLQLVLECHNRSFVLEAGATSVFSKGLILALAALTPEQLQSPITVCPQASQDEEKALFCRLYQGAELIRTVWPKEDESAAFRFLLERAKTNVADACR
ncbi:MAG: hypothetical protein F6J95_023755 [Leptolyngbya sp. SIO1E4]|nr:hypothetical protein [Leptolyngbya sp. SIO1E4]